MVSTAHPSQPKGWRKGASLKLALEVRKDEPLHVSLRNSSLHIPPALPESGIVNKLGPLGRLFRTPTLRWLWLRSSGSRSTGWSRLVRAASSTDERRLHLDVLNFFSRHRTRSARDKEGFVLRPMDRVGIVPPRAPRISWTCLFGRQCRTRICFREHTNGTDA